MLMPFRLCVCFSILFARSEFQWLRCPFVHIKKLIRGHNSTETCLKQRKRHIIYNCCWFRLPTRINPQPELSDSSFLFTRHLPKISYDLYGILFCISSSLCEHLPQSFSSSVFFRVAQFRSIIRPINLLSISSKPRNLRMCYASDIIFCKALFRCFYTKFAADCEG